MPKIELSDYLRSDCDLLKPSPVILMAIYDMSGGDPCRDCASRNYCITRKRLIEKANNKTSVKANVETNAEIANRMGLSKRQVSKMRKRGDL